MYTETMGRTAGRQRAHRSVIVEVFRSEARSESVLTIAQTILRQQYLSHWIACT
jgi:hypothetical protein